MFIMNHGKLLYKIIIESLAICIRLCEMGWNVRQYLLIPEEVHDLWLSLLMKFLQSGQLDNEVLDFLVMVKAPYSGYGR